VFRGLKKQDLPILREIHKRAGYAAQFPDIGDIGFVIEDEGKVVGWAGAELEAQIIGVFDPDWGSPHERVKTFASLHLPIAEQLELLGVKNATIFPDPQFKNFGNRLSRLGWSKTLWECYRMKVADVIKALKK